MALSPHIKLQTGNIPAEVMLAAKGYGCCFVTETHLKHIRLEENIARFSVGNPCTTVDFVAAFCRSSYLPYHAREDSSIVREFTRKILLHPVWKAIFNHALQHNHQSSCNHHNTHDNGQGVDRAGRLHISPHLSGKGRRHRGDGAQNGQGQRLPHLQVIG